MGEHEQRLGKDEDVQRLTKSLHGKIGFAAPEVVQRLLYEYLQAAYERGFDEGRRVAEGPGP